MTKQFKGIVREVAHNWRKSTTSGSVIKKNTLNKLNLYLADFESQSLIEPKLN